MNSAGFLLVGRPHPRPTSYLRPNYRALAISAAAEARALAGTVTGRAHPRLVAQLQGQAKQLLRAYLLSVNAVAKIP